MLICIKKVVDDGADQHLECSGRTNACTAGDDTCGINIHSSDSIVLMDKSGEDASDQCDGAGFTMCGLQISQIKEKILLIGLTDNMDLIAVIGSSCGDTVQLNTAGCDSAVIMICMIAKDLSSSGAGKKLKLLTFKCFRKPSGDFQISFLMHVYVAGAIHVFKNGM